MTVEEELLAALQAAHRLFREALPRFNWGASALDANAIRLLNEVPLQVERAISRAITAQIRGGDRRQIERRAGKRGVTVRHDDVDPPSTKRVRRGRLKQEKERKR